MSIRAKLLGAVVLLLAYGPAQATMYNFDIKVAPPTDANMGIDYDGIFGSAGGILVGQIGTVTFDVITDCQCAGGSIPPSFFYPQPNPISDATLTLNGHTYDFSSPQNGAIFGSGSGLTLEANQYLPHTQTFPNGFTQTKYSVAEIQIFPLAPNLDGGVFGYFSINTTGSNEVKGYFTAAPGPVAGAGLPGLVVAVGGLLAWWRRRRD